MPCSVIASDETLPLPQLGRSSASPPSGGTALAAHIYWFLVSARPDGILCKQTVDVSEAVTHELRTRQCVSNGRTLGLDFLVYFSRTCRLCMARSSWYQSPGGYLSVCLSNGPRPSVRPSIQRCAVLSRTVPVIRYRPRDPYRDQLHRTTHHYGLLVSVVLETEVSRIPHKTLLSVAGCCCCRILYRS